MSITKEAGNYIIRNIFASLGLSAYVIIDALFISIASGSMGLAALNIVLPVFNLSNAIGILFGIGGSSLYSMNKIRHPQKVEKLFSQLLLTGLIIGLTIACLGTLFAPQILTLLGATAKTWSLANIYYRIVICTAPFFICNYICINFIRNDANPRLTMQASLTETFCVILADAFLIFVCGLKIEGAAIATFVSPITSLLVLSRHRHFKGRKLKLFWTKPKLDIIVKSFKLGFPSCLTELSTGVMIFLFNIVLLKISGDTAIAAYGVISNIAIMTLALSNGVALGVQPLASREYGQKNFANAKSVIFFGLKISLALAVLAYLGLIIFRYPIVTLFNQEHSAALLKISCAGIPLYFISSLFASQNLVINMSLAAIDQAQTAFLLAILRGYVLIFICLMLLPHFLGLNGVWLASPLAEALTCLLGFIMLLKKGAKLSV